MLESDVIDTMSPLRIRLVTLSHGALVTNIIMHCFSVFLQSLCVSKLLVAHRALKVLAVLMHCFSVTLQSTWLSKLLVAHRALIVLAVLVHSADVILQT
jgi:hypothetical protein